MITFEREFNNYKHWDVNITNERATLSLNVSEKDGIRPGYELKLNSYDLGVDIELNDIIQRLRFEFPTVKVVIITSSQDKNFSAGANIYMLGMSEHSWKVNFCKFTNETRNSFEDSSKSGSLKFIAAINGICAGGGYEVALACDEILLVDDRSSTVSLPEVPLLGVLPGTGGLTRLTDKRKVRKDLADIFCTNADGVRGKKALDWKLVDFIAPPSKFDSLIDQRATAVAKMVKLRNGKEKIKLHKLNCSIKDDSIHYETISCDFDRTKRTAKINIIGPKESDVLSLSNLIKAGSNWWVLKFARELDDLILNLRTNELEIGVLIIQSKGSINYIKEISDTLINNMEHWFINETIGLIRRTFSRLDISSRSIFTIVENDSCFGGFLSEIIFCSDRSYMAEGVFEGNNKPEASMVLSESNFEFFKMSNGISRLNTRFLDSKAKISELAKVKDKIITSQEAYELGLVTFSFDDIDWDDEIRIFLEERASFSPDSMTGLEANLRFAGPETMETKIFGRLTAWQNWIFQRPNAVGEEGALKSYGTGNRGKFKKQRV